VEKELSKLYEKMQQVTNKHIWIKEAPKAIPKVGDVESKLIDIAKIYNDIKIDYAWSCIANNLNIEQSINMIYNYVENEERAFYITGEFRKIILSSSVVASSIIAYIMGRVVYENRKCTHEEIIITNALTEMTDFDIENFRYFVDECVETIGDYETINIRKADKEKMDSYKYTLHTLVSHGIVDTESGIMDGTAMYAGFHYIKTNLCTELLKYIDIVEQILDYGK